MNLLSFRCARQKVGILPHGDEELPSNMGLRSKVWRGQGAGERSLVCSTGGSMKNMNLLSGLIAAFAVPLVASSAQAYGGDKYIDDAQTRLKPGVYQGKVGRGQNCTVRVNLQKNGKERRYSVEITPTLTSYATDNGPTMISFSSRDARVLNNDNGAHAVSNSGDDYLVLGITPVKGGTFIRAYVKRGPSLKTAECTI